jgi:ArsR family transcriptional regulator, arsenate/arsenite/antimonite-responsive transcriptional repressor
MLNYIPENLMAGSSPTNLKQLAYWLKVLSEPNRLLIFNLLMQGIQCNCEIGDQLEMAPNLISHHIRILRKAGLVEIERDAVDSRWIYYSINTQVLAELNQAFGVFFNPERIQPRRPTCGPQFINIQGP